MNINLRTLKDAAAHLTQAIASYQANAPTAAFVEAQTAYNLLKSYLDRNTNNI